MLTGRGEPGSTIRVTDAQGNQLGTAVVNAAGSFAVTLVPAQTEGQSLEATAQDAAGNVSPAASVTAPNLETPIDNTPPDAPTDLLVSASGSQLSGRGEAGSTVTVRDAQGNAIATGIVQADGSFSLTLDPAVIDGSSLQVDLIDAADNVSESASVLTPDLIAPAQPTDLTLAEGVTLTGLGEPGATVQVRDASGAVIGSGVVGADGRFSVELNPAQANGEFIDVRLVDAAGNESLPLAFQAADITAPVAPFELQVSADGSVLSGRGEPGSTVRIVDAQGNALGSSVVGATGSFAVALVPAQTDGQRLEATAQDAAGNLSSNSSVVAPNLGTPVDDTPPEAPIDLLIGMAGRELSGRGEPGTSVTVRDAQGTVIASGAVGADGRFSVVLDPAVIDGRSVQVELTDAAGNVSPLASVVSPDLLAPAQPTDLALTAGVTLTGLGEPQASVQVRDASGAIIGSAVVGADGRFTVELSPAQANGEFVDVRLIDAAGNVSDPLTFQAPDITAPQAVTDVVVSADGLTVSGRGEIDASVEVRNADGTVIGTGIVGANGAFVIALDGAVAAGDVINLVQTDAAGNASPATDFTVPSTPVPSTPTELALNADGSELSGLATPGNRVEVHGADGLVLGSSVAGTDGSFTITLAPPQANGEALEVVAIDSETQQSSIPASINAPDITPPVAPSELAVSVDGSVLSGRGEPGSTVRVTNAQGADLGTAVVNAAGRFTITLQPPQTEGQTLAASAQDAAGNVSPSSSVTAPNLETPIDDTPPQAPSDLLINAGGSRLSGRGEAGAAVSVRDSQGNVIATGIVAADGTFSVSLDPAVVDGSTLQVALTDAAGNVSAATSVVSPDLLAPAQPTDLALAEGVTLTGRGEPNATVQVRNASGAVIASGVIGADGQFSVELNPPQANGEFIDVRLVDAAGNESSALQFQAPDITAPVAPFELAVSADGSVLSGRGEPGSSVRVTDAQGNALGSAVVNAAGSFALTLVPAQTAGQSLQATAQDAAGNLSPSTAVSAPNLETPVDDTAPDAPSGLTIDASGSQLGGRGEPGSTVTVRDAQGNVIATGVVAADGTFLVVLDPAVIDGSTLQVDLTDAAGNVSASTSVVSTDLTAPAQPTDVALTEGVTLTGRGEPGSTVQVRDASGAVIASGVVGADGQFSVELDPAQANGETLDVRLVDAAGNVSPVLEFQAPDITAPQAVTDVVVAADGLTVSGHGEIGANVEVRDAQGTLIGSGVVAANGAFVIALEGGLAAGDTINLVQTDAAGNASPASDFTIPASPAPAAPTALALNADGSVLSGLATPGNRVEVHAAGGTLLGSAIVAENGTFNITLVPVQANGEALEVVAIETATGQSSIPASITAADITAPAAPAELAVSADGSVLSGRGEPGSTVRVVDAQGNPLGTAVITAAGSFAVTLDPPQTAGQRLQVSAEDAAGNVSNSASISAPNLQTPTDDTPPEAPTGLVINAGGSQLSGRGEGGSTVTVRDAQGNVIGSGAVAANGSFSVALNPAITDGSTLEVQLSDAAGNVSEATAIASPDLTAPAQPSAVTLLDGVTLTGSGEPGATVQVRDATGAIIGSGQVAAGGTFSVTLDPQQANGELLDIRLIDAAGNSSTPLQFQAPDTTPPAAISNVVVGADGLSVSGAGEAGATVQVRDADGNVIGSGTVGAAGSFVLTLDSPVAAGQVISLIQTDAAGNASPATEFSVPSTPAPATPADLALNADGSTLTGVATSGTRVEVRAANGTLLGSAIANANGAVVITLTPAQNNGESLQVVAVDPVSGQSSIPAILNAPDITAPDAPTQLLVGADGSTLSGRAEAGSSIRVSNAQGEQLGIAQVAANGTFSVTLNPAQTAGQTLQVSAEDAAGNVSTSASISAPNLEAPTDDTPPEAPTGLLINVGGSQLTGSGEAGSTVTVRDAQGNVIASGDVTAEGEFSLTLDPPVIDGSRLQVILTDAAGNDSTAVSLSSPDLTPPAQPGDLQLVDGSVLSGTGEIGAQVVVRDGNGAIIGTAQVDATGRFELILEVPQFNGETLDIRLLDAAGNSSAPLLFQAPDISSPDPVSDIVVSVDGSLIGGRGEPGATVSVRDGNGQLLGAGVVGVDGNFVLTLAPAVQAGDTLTLVQTDAAGLSSDFVNHLVSAIPALPSPGDLLLAEDGSSLSGSAPAGVTVHVRNVDGETLASVVVGAEGTFSVPLNPPIANGQPLHVVALDANGSSSLPTPITAPDLTPPDTPVELSVSADGSLLIGRAEPGSQVQVRDAQGTLLGSGTANSTGSFVLGLDPAQVDGQALQVSATDAAGNTSISGNVTAPDHSVPVDVTPPQPATALAISNDGSRVSGRGEPGTVVRVLDAQGQVLVEAAVPANGEFTVQLQPPVIDGSPLRVTLTDAAGNSSSAPLNAPDLLAPAPADDLLLSDGQALTGSAEAGARVEVRDASGELLGSVVADGEGRFSLTLDTPLRNGETLTVQVIDAAGNRSTPLDYAVPDTTPPAAVSEVQIDLTDSVLAGRGEPGALVQVRDADGVSLGSAQVAGDGSFRVILDPPVTAGAVLTVVQQDAAGNLSTALEFSVPPTVLPASPSDVQVSADGSSVSGNAPVGGEVQVRDAAGTLLGSAPATANGSFDIPLDPPLRNGESLSVVVVDAAGNSSLPTATAAPDTTAPLPASDLQLSADGSTLSGRGEAGARVEVRNAQGEALGSAVVADNGSFSLTLQPAQIQGQQLDVSLTDAAGNSSVPSSVTAPDLLGPLQPSAIVVDASGSLLSGVGQVGSTITVRGADGEVLGSTTVGASGRFEISLEPAQRNGQQISVEAADAAGNSATPVLISVADTQPPAPVEALQLSEDGLQVSGRGEAGAQVSVRAADGSVLGSAQVGTDGTFSVILDNAQRNGQALTVEQRDAAGNVSEQVALQAPDLEAPVAPSELLLSADGTTLTGIGEPGTTVTVRNAQGLVGSAEVGADGRFSVALNPAQLNGQTLSTTLTDDAGNVSSAVELTPPDRQPPLAADDLLLNTEGTLLSGSAEAGSRVEVRDAAGALLGSGEVDDNGRFSVSLPAQTNGEVLAVQVIDGQGNASPSVGYTAADTTAPEAPSELQINASGSQLSGRGEVGSVVEVRNAAGVLVGEGVVLEGGAFLINLQPVQNDGQALQVTLRDAAGNTSEAADLTAPNTAPPEVPASATVSLDGSTVSGSAPGASQVVVRDAAGNELASAPVAADGSFSVSLPNPLTNGEALNVVAVDGGGLNSAELPIYAPDTTPPAAAQNVAINADGNSINGSAEPGSTVIVRNATGELGQTIAAGDGSFVLTVEPPLQPGDSAEVVVIDRAGNQTLEPVSVSVPPAQVIDTPSALQISLDGFSLSGQASAGTVVSVSAGGVALGSATVGSDGSFLVFFERAQLNGEVLQVSARAANGVVSDPASITARDITPPDAPLQIIVERDGAGLTGRGEAGATVSVRDTAGNLLGTAQVDDNGAFRVDLQPAPVNGETLLVRLTDAAGNPSPISSVQAPDITPPQAATALALNDAATVLSGRGEAGASVNVRDANGVLLATGTVNLSGQFQITLPNAQISGARLQVTLSDAAGNLSDPASIATPDRTPPVAVSQLNLSVDGSQLTGSGEPGASVRVRNAAGAVIGSATVDADGYFSVTFTPPQNSGQPLGVTQVDAAGNVSPAVTLSTPDLQAPLAPSNLVLNNDGLTLRGVGEAGSQVSVRNAQGALIGSGQVAANGSFTLTLDSVQLNGEALSVVLTDAAGNVSSPARLVAPDLTPPAAPSDLLLASGGLQLSGSAEAGSTITVRTASGEVLGTVQVASNGTFQLTLDSAQSNGERLSISATDAAGNVSPLASLIAADTTPPALVSHLAVAADGSSLSGHGEVGATVTVRNADGEVLGTAEVDADGHFIVTLEPAAAPGTTLSVVQADASDNLSPSETFTLPGVPAPEVPAALQLADDGLSVSGQGSVGSRIEVYGPTGLLLGSAEVRADGSFTVNLQQPQANGERLEVSAVGEDGTRSLPAPLQAPDTTAPQPLSELRLSVDGLVVSGRGEAGAQVSITGNGGVILGSGQVAANGRFSITLDAAQINGERLDASQTDAAGNTSASVSLLAPDMVAPDVADNLQLTAGGSLLQGTGEAAARVSVVAADGSVIGTGTVRLDGTFQIALLPVQANGETFEVVLTDAAGNRSAAAEFTAPDTTPPAALSEVSVAADGASLSGRGEVGARVTVRTAGGESLGSATVDASGNFTLLLDPPLGNAEVLSLSQADAAGNVSPVITLTTPDFTPPAALTEVRISADGAVVTGRGEPGASVTISDAAGVVIGRGVVEADETFRIELSPAQIDNQQLSVVQADPPGNLSEAVLVIAPDRTPPLAPQELRLNAAGDLLSGTGEAGSTVRVSVAGVEVGRATVAADGRFSVELDTPLRNGEQLLVSLEDASQNLSLPTLLDAPDLTPPAQVQASLDAEGTRLSGSGEAGARLTVLNDFGDQVGQGTIDAEGRFVVELTPPQRNGEVLSVIAQDAAGNPSQPLLLSAPDLTPPAQLQDLTLNTTGSTLTGSGEVGSTVRVRGADGSLLGEAQVPAGGAFVITLLPPQANGQTLTVIAADAAGNSSTPQTVIAADTTAPDPVSSLSINSAYDVLVGRGEAGATVRVLQGSTVLGSAEVGADGRFQVSLSPKANPGVELAVAQTDGAGNTSAATLYATPLEPVPATPTLVQLSVDGLVVSGRATAGSEVRVVNAAGTLLGSAQANAAGTFVVELDQAQLNGQRLEVSARSSGGESQPFVLVAADVTPPAQPLVTALSANGLVLSGSGEVGATVTVRSANGALLGTAVVGLAGSFSVDLASAQLNGQVLSVRQTDAAGNASPVLSYSVPDVQAPLAPSNLQLLDSGSRLSGVGEAGARVEVTGRGGVVLGSTTVAANGEFSLALNAVQADGQVLSVRQTDAAGNTSASASLTAPDTTPPALPSATLNAAGTLLSGSGEAGARVIVRSNGNVVGQALVAANGTFVVTLSTAQINHETLSVSLTDAAGNVSPVLTLTAPDITPPAVAGNLLVNATGSELSGSGEVGASVTVRGADGSVLQSGVVIGADGTFRITLNPVQDNGQRLSVTLTDPRGNVSGIATVVAPDVDVDRPVVASDNLVTAEVNLAPVTSKLPVINDSYSLLVGVNTTKAFTWSVAAGTTVNPTLTLSVDNLVGVLNNPTFTLQVKNAAGAWVDVATGSNSALLTLVLLPGVGVRAEIGALRAGDYQLLVTSGGLGVLTTVNTRLDLEVTSLTQFTGSGVVKSGNVISDAGTDGTADILGPDNGAVLQVLKDGVYVNAGSATSVQGLYGTLVIKADGSYTYTPSGTPASVGKVDVFSYQLSHPNGKSDTANLYVRIDSPQATEIWNEANLGAPASVLDAVDDVGRSTVSLTNKLTTDSQAFDPISLAGLAGTRVGTVTHTVASNTTADLEVNLTTNSLLNLGNSITLELRKLSANGSYAVVETVSGSQLLDLLGSGGKTHVFRDQTAGTYQVAIKAAVAIGLSGSVTASLDTTTKSLTEFVVSTATTATGNLLTGDTLGSSLTTLSVQTAANTYALPGYNGVSVAGLYGTLLVFADGSYSYTLKSGLGSAVVGQVDTFNYALTHPNGSSDTAQLKITIATGASAARMLEAQTEDGSEAVVLAALADQQDDGQDSPTPVATDEPTSAAQSPDDASQAEQSGFASVAADNADTTLLWQGGDASIDLASLVGEVQDLEVLDLNTSSAVSLSLTLDDVLAVTQAQGNTLLIKGDENDSVRFGDAWTLTGQDVADGIDYNQYTAEEDPGQQLWVQNGVHVV